MKNCGSININLLEKDTGREKAVIYMMTAILLVVAVLGSMAGLYFYQHRQLTAQKELNSQLQTGIKNMQKENPLPTGETALQNELSKKDASVRKVEVRKVSYVDMLGEIEKTMPARMMMTGIEFTDKKITLEGYSQDYDNEAQLLAGLRKVPAFKDVALVSSKLDDSSREIEFKIDLNWEAAKK